MPTTISQENKQKQNTLPFASDGSSQPRRAISWHPLHTPSEKLVARFLHASRAALRPSPPRMAAAQPTADPRTSVGEESKEFEGGLSSGGWDMRGRKRNGDAKYAGGEKKTICPPGYHQYYLFKNEKIITTTLITIITGK